ncbi:MAG: M15 family metallopeptidase, partial [Desulfovibrionaceae bacterium]
MWTALAAVLLAALLAAAPGPARAGEAAPASTPSELRAAALRAAGLVNLADVAPGVLIDIRYATAQNTFGRVLYPSAACWLRVEAAEAVARAQAALKPKGLGLKVWDCYRPFSVQESLWADVPNPDFVAEPRRDAAGTPVLGSKHNRGKAVDIT